MLQIVAFPVALMVSAPGPKYSTMAPVPPLTVSRFGDLAGSRPWATPSRTATGETDTDEPWPANVEGEAGHDVDGVTAAHADGDHAQAPGVGGVAVGADHHPAGEGVVLEDDLVDDPRARFPEADAEF